MPAASNVDIDVDSLRVVDLKAELKKRGFKVPKARKAELQAMLREALETECSDGTTREPCDGSADTNHLE